ncbi:MAG: glycosyltransferase family 39 protein [bacterium]
MARFKPRARNLPGWLLLVAALAPGVYFRITDLSGQGPRLWDEGIYLQEARFLYTLTQAVWDSAVLKGREAVTREDLWKKDEQIAALGRRIRGAPPIFGRVTHDATLALGMLVWGPQDAAVGARVNALTGILSLFLLYGLARRLYGSRAAFFATLVFSLMGYHIHYCRSTMAETTTVAFLIAAFHFYAASRTLREHRSSRSLALAALLLGLAFTTHNRMIVAWGLFVLLEARFWICGPAPVRLRRFAAFHVFFLLPLVAWELPYYLAFLATKHMNIVVSAPTYFEQVVVALGRSALWGYISKAYRLDGFLTFPYLMAVSCGVLPLALAAAGLVAGLRRRSPADLLVASWFLLPYCLYSFTTAGLARVFTVLLPAAALLAGSLWADGSKEPWFPRIRAGAGPFWVQTAAVVLLLGNGLYFGWRSARSEDGYAEVAERLRARGEEGIVTTNVPVLEVYCGQERVANVPPASRQELEALFENGHRYYVIDCNRQLYAWFQKERVEVMDAVAAAAAPVTIVPNPFVRDPLTLFEANLFFWDTLRLQGEVERLALDRIEVYDFGQLFQPHPGP